MVRKLIVGAFLLVLLTPLPATAALYPPPEPTTTKPTPTTQATPTTKAGVTTTKANVVPTTVRRVPPRLPETGASGISSAVRAAVVLLVAGFLLYLVGRNRRAARTREAMIRGSD